MVLMIEFKVMKPKLLLFLFLIIHLIASAQFSEQLRHHVIIAFDEARGQWDYQQQDVARNAVFDFLSDSIIREGDILSVVGFSIDENASNLSNFTYVINDEQLGALSHLEYNALLRKHIFDNWSSIASKQKNIHTGADLFSMITLAKIYAVAPVRKTGTRHYVNRTFLIMLSDHYYNGNDFHEEFNMFRDFNRKITAGMVQDYGQRSVSEYFVKHIKGRTKDYRSEGKKHVDLYEYLPLQDNISLPAVIDFESQQLIARRIKGGKYNIDISSINQRNPHYNLLKLRYRLYNAAEKVLLDTIYMAKTNDFGDFIPIDSLIVSYKTGSTREAVKLKIDAWVGLNDGFYNATVLTPVDGAPPCLGQRGLSVTVPIVYEQTAKILGLGILPLPSFLMFSDNQDQCNAVCSVVVVFLILAVVLWFANWLRKYKPKMSDLEIERIDD